MKRPIAIYGHYLRLALLAFGRAPVLTALVILTVTVGIGASMTVYTTLRSMAGDPIPGKSDLLFAVQIENRALLDREMSNEPPNQLTYRDAVALLQRQSEFPQAAMFPAGAIAVSSRADLLPFYVSARAATPSFFRMFDVPFRFGGGWTQGDEEARANVVVLGAEINDRLFGGSNSIGRTLNLNGQSYRILGVLEAWNPMPLFYDTINGPFRKAEDVFIPLNTAIDRQVARTGQVNCTKPYEPNLSGFLNSECTWIQFWVNLTTPDAETRYRRLLVQYALDQQRSGRFSWKASTRVQDVRQWLIHQKVVPNEFRMASLLGFAFLLVCLINAVGLILGKFGSRTTEFGVRRALGASRGDLVAQCILECAVLGALGGMFGLALTHVGLALERTVLPPELRRFAYIDSSSVFIAVTLAVLATVLTGLYPAWQISRTQSASELKAL